ncbi:MAG: glycosyltransferase family 4 protein [Clostridia bacterium]
MSITINMISKAHTVKGQGVFSAYEEQVSIIENNLSNEFKVLKNSFKKSDICHYHTINLEFFLALPFKKLNAATVGYVHFLPETLENSIKLPKLVKKVFYKYVLNFYNSMDFLVTVNPYFIDRLGTYGIDTEKVSYIPNYVSKKRFYKIEEKFKKDIKNKYKIDKNKFVVLCVGQLQKRKGVVDFIKVAKMMPEVEFVWAGGFSFKKISDGYEEIKKIVENPPENVKFLGIIPREEMNELYNIGDVMFLPSYEELFPMTILESANCNVPILLRDIELYEGILAGYYLKGNNIEEFKDQINKLKNDKDYYKKASLMAKGCSDFYSEENVTKMWQSYYNKVYDICKEKSWRKKIYEKEDYQQG